MFSYADYYNTFLGMVVMMILYIAICFAQTRRREYAYYLGYMMSVVLFYGLLKADVLAHAFVRQTWGIHITCVTTVLFYNLFANEFLDLPTHAPRLSRIAWVNVSLTIGSGILMSIAYFGLHNPDLATQIVNIFKLVVFAAGLFVVFRVAQWRNVLSRYFAIGSFFLIGFEVCNMLLMLVCHTDQGLTALRYLSPGSVLSYPFFFSKIATIGELLFLTIGLIYKNHQLELAKLRANIAQQEALDHERRRIARDMHDDLGSGLSALHLISKYAQHKEKNGEIHAEIARIATISSDLNQRVREIIWAVSATDDNADSLVYFLRRYAAEFATQHGLEFSADLPDDLPTTAISGEVRRNVFLSLKESLNNVAKYAQATQLHFAIEIIKRPPNTLLQITLTDNGIGFDAALALRNGGNGLRNIQQRMTDIGGAVTFAQQEGTITQLAIPI